MKKDPKRKTPTLKETSFKVGEKVCHVLTGQKVEIVALVSPGVYKVRGKRWIFRVAAMELTSIRSRK